MCLENIKIKISKLSLNWYKKYPVWTWYIGDIHEPEDIVCPVDIANPSLNLNDYDTLFIKSDFKTSDNHLFKGSISYDLNSDNVYEIELFVDDKEFGFNSNLGFLALKDLKRLRSALKNESAVIFPISYKTDSTISKTILIDGSFELDL